MGSESEREEVKEKKKEKRVDVVDRWRRGGKKGKTRTSARKEISEKESERMDEDNSGV